MDTVDLITPEEPVEETNYSEVYKFVVFLWVTFCVVGFTWFSSRMFRGREQLKTNFRNIEEHLKRLQEALEENERDAITDGSPEETPEAPINALIGKNDEQEKNKDD